MFGDDKSIDPEDVRDGLRTELLMSNVDLKKLDKEMDFSVIVLPLLAEQGLERPRSQLRTRNTYTPPMFASEMPTPPPFASAIPTPFSFASAMPSPVHISNDYAVLSRMNSAYTALIRISNSYSRPSTYLVTRVSFASAMPTPLSFASAIRILTYVPISNTSLPLVRISDAYTAPVRISNTMSLLRRQGHSWKTEKAYVGA